MVQTVKFSQFLPPVDIQAGDILVGLRDGKNQQFNAVSGTGNGNALIVTVTQDNHGFVPGDWLYLQNLSPTTYQYAKAIATSIETSNVVGVVIKVDDINTFNMCVVGYIGPVDLPFIEAPFEPGTPYFLDANAAGEMTSIEPLFPGQISMPVFYAETTLTGYVHQSRQLYPGLYAPSDDTYIVQTADPANLPNAQSLGDLASGIVYNTQTGSSGVLSTLPVVPLALGGTQTPLSDPGIDALFGWDNGTHQADFLGIGTGLAISGGNLINTGSSTGDPVIHIVTNNTTPHGFTNADIGLALRVDSTSTTAQPVYVKALADSAANAEAVGIFIGKIDDNNFYLQEIGYNNVFTQAVFTSLTPGAVYFLSDMTLGHLTDTPPVTPGHVSKPMFVAEGATSGWIYSMRGVVIGETPTPPPPGENNLLQQTVTQANTFVLGDIIRLQETSPTTSEYILADATTEAGVQAVGMVVEIVTMNSVFVVQMSGYVGSATGAVSGKVAGNAYYLDPANPGKMTITEPTTIGVYSKLIFITDTVASGWLCEQREHLITEPAGSGLTDTIIAANTFNVGNIVYPQTLTPFYTLAQADTLAHANSVGMVVAASASQFTVQQNGFVNVLSGLTAATPYWLDPATPGAMTPTKPTGIGLVVKPVFYSTNTTSGWIQEQVGILNTNPSGGGGNQLITSVNITNQPSVYLSNIFDGTYQDIQIVGENFVLLNNSTGQYIGNAFGLQVETAGVLRTANYNAYNDQLGIVGGGQIQRSPSGTRIYFANSSAPVFTADMYTTAIANLSAPGGRTLGFTININGIDSTSYFKCINIAANYFTGVANNQFAQNFTTAYYGQEVPDTLNITGFNLLFDLGIYTIYSGTLSVYGTKT